MLAAAVAIIVVVIPPCTYRYLELMTSHQVGPWYHCYIISSIIQGFLKNVLSLKEILLVRSEHEDS